MNTEHAFQVLRRANPVSVASPSADAEKLLASITTGPRETHRRPRVPRRALVAIATAILAAAVVVGAAPAISSWIGDIIAAPEVNAEYSDATKDLPLPPGYHWPELAFGEHDVSSRGAGGAFAVAIAQSAWECYWVRSINQGDTHGQTRARAALADLMRNHIVVAPAGASENWTPPERSTPTSVFANDGGYQFKQRMYSEAAAGSPTLLEQSCRANRPAGWHD